MSEDTNPIPTKKKISSYFINQQNSLPALLARMTALDGVPFSLFITSSDLRRCLSAMGHNDLPKSANTVRGMVCKYADSVKTALRDEIQKEKSGGSRFSLTFDEWTSF